MPNTLGLKTINPKAFHRIIQMNSTLQFLMFELLDADEHSHTWEAMASVAPQRVPAVLADVTRVLAWAQGQLGTAPQALDDGGDWDALLQMQADQHAPHTLTWHPTTGCAALPTLPTGTQWVAVTLTLVVTAALADAVQQQLDAFNAV